MEMEVNMGNVLGLVFANMHDMTLGDLTKNRTMGNGTLQGKRAVCLSFRLSEMLRVPFTEAVSRRCTVR